MNQMANKRGSQVLVVESTRGDGSEDETRTGLRASSVEGYKVKCS